MKVFEEVMMVVRGVSHQHSQEEFDHKPKLVLRSFLLNQKTPRKCHCCCWITNSAVVGWWYCGLLNPGSVIPHHSHVVVVVSRKSSDPTAPNSLRLFRCFLRLVTWWHSTSNTFHFHMIFRMFCSFTNKSVFVLKATDH